MSGSPEANARELIQLRQTIETIERQNSATSGKNLALVAALKEAREQIAKDKEAMDRLALPPSAFGTVLEFREDDVVDIQTGGRKLRVAVSPSVDPAELIPGREVILNEALHVIEVLDFERLGEVVIVKEVLADGKRVLVTGHADEDTVVSLAGLLIGCKPRVGDSLLIDSRTKQALEVIPKTEVNDLELEELPDIDYADIGGLAPQIEAIRDAVELPYLYPELFSEYKLRPPKGVLLYGPPGCGKTLIAKAVASGLGRRMAAEGNAASASAFFINVKGPELLNKYVGETERRIRLIFARAREKASAGNIVVIFFDEMESLFRTRGSGVSSDVETTIVPQLLAEMDGVEDLKNVLVIGASNREDMIDPAILRPGRLDVKIKVERPDAEGAEDIFTKYLTADLPLRKTDLAENNNDPAATVAAIIRTTVQHMYAETAENRFLEVTYANGDKDIQYFKDFSSGAMIQNIVDRAKKMAIKDFLELKLKPKGLSLDHLEQAVRDEFKENEDLPNTTNPDDWARISGKKGERIVYIRTLVPNKKKEEQGGKEIPPTVNVPTGQYL